MRRLSLNTYHRLKMFQMEAVYLCEKPANLPHLSICYYFFIPPGGYSQCKSHVLFSSQRY